MHIFVSGIGGTGVGPLAMIAKQAGYEVSGSDKQDSSYVENIKKSGIVDVSIGQTTEAIEELHKRKPIDWYIYSSAVEKEDPDNEEFRFVDKQGIKRTKRDDFINLLLKEKNLKMLAVAGTHGKTTTTAMIVWLFKSIGNPVSYLVPAKVSFGPMGKYDPKSKYFIYEADEYDKNFLSYSPALSVITGVAWDHQEIYPTREDYNEAFHEFLNQSKFSFLWEEDAKYLDYSPKNGDVMDSADQVIEQIHLAGKYNRFDGWLAVNAVHKITGVPIPRLLKKINKFPGLQRRMEEIRPGLYSDYAHTVEKIRGAMSVALELADIKHKDLVIVYEGLHNRRQHYIIDDYDGVFEGSAKLYWVPSYLAREDKTQKILEPKELIKHLDDPSIAEPAKLDEELKKTIQTHLQGGDLVVGMSGGGGGSLDEWLRSNFKQ